MKGRPRGELSSKPVVELRVAYRDRQPGLSSLGCAELRVATPCAARRDEPVRGIGRARYCWRCGRDVYDIASLSPEDARAVLGVAEETACRRLYARRDGTVMKGDCPVGLRRRIVGGVIVVALLAIACATAFGKRAFPPRLHPDLSDWRGPGSITLRLGLLSRGPDAEVASTCCFAPCAMQPDPNAPEPPEDW